MAIPSTTSPIGFFVAAPGELGPPSPMLADNIDPNTKDYASLFVGMNSIESQVIMAMTTIKGSGASVQSIGTDPPPRKMGTGYTNTMIADARAALSRLVTNRDIRLIKVDFDIDDPTNQSAQLRVVWRNLRSIDAVDRTTVVPVPGGNV